MSTEEMHFRMDGEWFTDFSRNLIFEERWRFALETITDYIHGTTMEQAISILSGKQKFVGDSDDGWLLEDDNYDVIHAEQMEFFNRILDIDGKHYKFYAAVTSFGYPDLHVCTLASRVVNMSDEDAINEFAHTEQMTKDEIKTEYYQLERGKHYRENLSDVVLKVNDIIFLLKEVQVDIPLWLSISTDPEEVVKHSTFSETGYIEYYNDSFDTYQTIEDKADAEQRAYDRLVEEGIQERKAYEENLVRWKEQIIAQTDEWIEIKQNRKVLAKVPKVPFIRWCLSRTLAFHLMPEWENVCPMGLKMSMDNRDHTDWMVGGGLDLDDDYSYDHPIQEAAYKMMFSIQEEWLNFEATVLCNGGERTGRIKFCTLGTKPEEVNDGDIIVVSTAGPEFQLHVERAIKSGYGGVISMTGGKLCHLATIGRELGFTMMMDMEAFSKYQDRMIVRLDPEVGRISIMEMGWSTDIDKLKD